MAKAGARLDRIARKVQEAGFDLPAGATDEQIAQAEQALGITFPEEVRAFYRRHDGGPLDEEICDGRELLSLERVVEEWSIWKELLDKGTFEDNDNKDVEEGILPHWWIPTWIPVTYDGAGNHHVLDLSPAPGGKHGRILSFWHDDSARTIEAGSLLEWLADVVEWGEAEDDGEE